MFHKPCFNDCANSGNPVFCVNMSRLTDIVLKNFASKLTDRQFSSILKEQKMAEKCRRARLLQYFNYSRHIFGKLLEADKFALGFRQIPNICNSHRKTCRSK